MKELLKALINAAYSQIGNLELQIEDYKRVLDKLDNETATDAHKETKLERFIARGPLGLIGD